MVVASWTRLNREFAVAVEHFDVCIVLKFRVVYLSHFFSANRSSSSPCRRKISCTGATLSSTLSSDCSS